MVYRRMQTGGLRIWRHGSGELGVHSWKRGWAVLRTRLISHLERGAAHRSCWGHWRPRAGWTKTGENISIVTLVDPSLAFFTRTRRAENDSLSLWVNFSRHLHEVGRSFFS